MKIYNLEWELEEGFYTEDDFLGFPTFTDKNLMLALGQNKEESWDLPFVVNESMNWKPIHPSLHIIRKGESLQSITVASVFKTTSEDDTVYLTYVEAYEGLNIIYGAVGFDRDADPEHPGEFIYNSITYSSPEAETGKLIKTTFGGTDYLQIDTFTTGPIDSEFVFYAITGGDFDPSEDNLNDFFDDNSDDISDDIDSYMSGQSWASAQISGQIFYYVDYDFPQAEAPDTTMIANYIAGYNAIAEETGDDLLTEWSEDSDISRKRKYVDTFIIKGN